MKKAAISMAACALPLSACTGIQGPPEVINARGVLPRPLGGSLEERFVAAARIALATDSTQAEHKEFLRSGTMLIYTRCNDFFQHTGRNQGRSRLARDYIAPVIALLNGVLAIHDFGDDGDKEQNILQVLTLGSNFATAALDIHDRHFLFGSDNVDSVREMTFNALSSHRLAVMERDIESVEDVVEHLVDNQTICTPPHILRLARQAIANSRPETVDAHGHETGPEADADGDADWTSSQDGEEPQSPEHDAGRVGVRIPE